MNQGGAFFAAGTCWNEPHRTSSCNFSPLQCKIALLIQHSITVQSALVQVSDVMWEIFVHWNRLENAHRKKSPNEILWDNVPTLEEGTFLFLVQKCQGLMSSYYMCLLKKGGLTSKYYKNLWHGVLQLWFLLVFEINIEQWRYTMNYLSTMLSIGARNEDGAPVQCTTAPLLVKFCVPWCHCWCSFVHHGKTAALCTNYHSATAGVVLCTMVALLV